MILLFPSTTNYTLCPTSTWGGLGFQILRHGPRLGRFICKVAGERPGDRLGLVLSGDVIDSLPEDIQGYFSMEKAESMMERIYREGTFDMRWSDSPGLRYKLKAI